MFPKLLVLIALPPGSSTYPGKCSRKTSLCRAQARLEDSGLQTAIVFLERTHALKSIIVVPANETEC